MDLTQAIMEAVAASNRMASKNFADMFNCNNSNDSNSLEPNIEDSKYRVYRIYLVALALESKSSPPSR